MKPLITRIKQNETSSITLTSVWAVQQLIVEQNAVVHIQIQYGVEHVEIVCHRDAQVFVTFRFASSCTMHLALMLQEPGACVNVRGAYVLQGQDNVHIVTQQQHNAPQTKSDILVKGILDDQACASYQGTIMVAQEARGTCASQYNKHLLLSPYACATSMPSLEVLTDDVQCAHGSAAGFIDAEQLFYLQSRGVNEAAAKKIVTKAFLHDVQLV